MKKLLFLAVAAVAACAPRMSPAQSILSPNDDPVMFHQEITLGTYDSTALSPGAYEYKYNYSAPPSRNWPEAKNLYFISLDDSLYREIQKGPKEVEVKAKVLDQALFNKYSDLYEQKLETLKMSDAKRKSCIEQYNKLLMKRRDDGNCLVLISCKRK